MANYIDLLECKNLLWRGRGQAAQHDVVSTRFAALDDLLCGGWPQQGVIGVKTAMGIGELRLILPHFVDDNRLKVLINPPGQIHAAALHYLSLDLSEFMIVQPPSEKEALWAAEQCVKSGVCSALVLWHEALSIAAVKRLQLGAQAGSCRLFVLHQAQYAQTLPFTLSVVLQAQHSSLDVTVKKHKGHFAHRSLKLENPHYWPELEKPNLPHVSDNIVAFSGYERRLTS
ncbi:translesion DNA synthesis-associated protein ImuA [Pseudoalteromonas sp. A757]|uniref:translesion DNA synthesis-associated protein ImuA n=1 Tax=Pseudoalteromonas sp. A757 TaxID=2250709 RepID=UPI000FFE420B|nr:translesion DNA synthesis-associated protein ImuA [Pseudoalteromonas sp. A757]RXE86654.1 translesion DNA synthesis-associated protein ImuA [Pseudoalteromonas sp. A757]